MTSPTRLCVFYVSVQSRICGNSSGIRESYCRRLWHWCQRRKAYWVQVLLRYDQKRLLSSARAQRLDCCLWPCVAWRTRMVLASIHSYCGSARLQKRQSTKRHPRPHPTRPAHRPSLRLPLTRNEWTHRLPASLPRRFKQRRVLVRPSWN